MSGTSSLRRVEAPTVFLDDDPTGMQLMAGVPMLLAFSPAEVAAALARHPSAHLMTNSRALPARAAFQLTLSAARQAHEGAPEARIALRGDSTLRGHLLPEYDAVRDVVFPGLDPVLLLVPALPSAGRVTLGGVHQLRDGDRLTPLDQTEYARDGEFAYRSARLAEFADQRSGGRFAAARAQEVSLGALRDRGPGAVSAALTAAAAAGPAVVAVDVEQLPDLSVIRAGLLAAEGDGVPVVLRSGPAFAAVLADRLATGPAPLPPLPAGVLVVCGSYVSNTTRQLERLRARTGCTITELRLDRLADDPAEEVARAAAQASTALRATGLAVLATPRERRPSMTDLASGELVARSLAQAAAAVRPAPSLVVTKGGITSAVIVREGFGARSAEVVGPPIPGTSLLDLGPDLPAVVIFPGNTGTPDGLAELVELARAGR